MLLQCPFLIVNLSREAPLLIRCQPKDIGLHGNTFCLFYFSGGPKSEKKFF